MTRRSTTASVVKAHHIDMTNRTADRPRDASSRHSPASTPQTLKTDWFTAADMVVISRARMQGGTLRTLAKSLNLFAPLVDKPFADVAVHSTAVCGQTVPSLEGGASTALPGTVRTGGESTMEYASDEKRKQPHARGGRFGRPSCLSRVLSDQTEQTEERVSSAAAWYQRHLSYDVRSRRGGFVFAATSPAALTWSVL